MSSRCVLPSVPVFRTQAQKSKGTTDLIWGMIFAMISLNLRLSFRSVLIAWRAPKWSARVFRSSDSWVFSMTSRKNAEKRFSISCVSPENESAATLSAERTATTLSWSLDRMGMIIADLTGLFFTSRP